jgi:hypothetical protein
MAHLDLATLLAALVGVSVGVAFAVLAGRASARVIFDASRRGEDESEVHPGRP